MRLLSLPRSLDDAVGLWRDEAAGSPARLRQLAALVPCTAAPPADPRERRKWALAGLRRFYAMFPFRNEDGSLVQELAPYQLDVWCDRFEPNDFGLPSVRLYVKSQKIGQSMLHLLECIHIALSPRAFGREIMVIGQNQPKAESHLADLTDMLRRSRFAPFVISGPTRDANGRVRRDRMSRAAVTMLVNPADPDGMATRIHAASITSKGGLLSNKHVEHIHMSDIAAATGTTETIDKGIGNAQSRLTKSHGSLVIETMPGSTAGRIYGMYREACREQARRIPDADVRRLVPGTRALHDTGIVRRFPWTLAVEQGVITRKKIEEYRLGLKNAYDFARLYEADFLSGDLTAYHNPVRRTDAAATELLMTMMANVPGGTS